MLVGRQAEQQAIDRLVAAARLGTSGVLAVTGEAGVGKTALLEAAVAGLGDMRVLRATGLESERELSFGALLQLLRPALAAREGIPRVQADALAAALGLPRADAAPGSRDRFTIGAAVLSVLCRYAEDGPLAVVVDDLQLVDTPSVDALVFAARRLAADPIVVLCGVRIPEGDQVAAGLPALRLEGIDLDAARALVAGAHPHPVPEEHVEVLHRATAGNPLALLELGAADREVVESMETGLPVRVSRAVTGAFARRLARLDDEARAALLVAAVCGPDLRHVTDACGMLNVDAGRLGAAEDAGLIAVAAGRVAFRHPLLRAAVYSGAPVDDRRRAHRAAADALPRGDVDRRAWHLSEAVWEPDAAVADLLAEAGEHAVSRAAFAVAASAFERSARLMPDVGVRAERLLRAADAAWRAGEGDRALTLLDMRAPGGSPDLRDLELRASVAARTGTVRDALGILLTAAGRPAEAAEQAVFLADAVHATYYLGDARTASELAGRLEALLPHVADPRARALGLMATGIARILAGHGGVDDIRAAVPLLESGSRLRDDPRRLSWLLLAPLFLRDATAGARLRTLVDQVRGAAGVGALPAVLFHVARDQATTAAWSRAEANYAEAIRLAVETGQDTELAMSLASLAWLESRSGKADACRAHAARADDLCRARGIRMGQVWIAFALGDLELSLGRAEAAVTQFAALAETLAERGLDDPDLAPAPELVDALLRLGRPGEARAEAEAFARRAAQEGQPWALARADRAQALVADGEECVRLFERALVSHARTLDRFEDARTHLAFGERLRRMARRVDARRELRAALEVFADLGAEVWRAQAVAELAATGEHVHAGAASATASLTPQELQVSVLLAEGRTTREAAAALFLSPKTVEYHLRKVYTKLGIGSRAELARAIAEID